MERYYVSYNNGILTKSKERAHGLENIEYNNNENIIRVTFGIILPNDIMIYIYRDWITRFTLRERTSNNIGHSYRAVKMASFINIRELDEFMDELGDMMGKLYRGESMDDQLIIDYYNEAIRYAEILAVLADKLHEDSKRYAAEINLNRQSKSAAN